MLSIKSDQGEKSKNIKSRIVCLLCKVNLILCSNYLLGLNIVVDIMFEASRPELHTSAKQN